MNNLAILEKQILHCWIDNPNLVFEDDIFISENAKEFAFIILDLLDNKMDLIPEHILAKKIEYVSEESLESILNTNYQLDKYNYYKDNLSKKYLLYTLKTEMMYELESEDDDSTKLDKIKDTISTLEKTDLTTSLKGKSFSDLVKNHTEVLNKRAKGIKNSIGDFMFDRIMPNPSAGISILAGFSGSMKSTMCIHLAKIRISKRLPTLFLNSELSEEAYVDILTSSMVDEPIEDIMGVNNDDNHVDYDSMIKKYEELANHYENLSKFRMYPKSTASIKDLKPFIIQARKDFAMKDDELLVFFIDLLSMLQDFQEGSNLQTAILKGINKLNEVALETNTLMFCTIQLRRMETVHIHKMEDVEKFRVSASQLKDSSEFENRARWVGCILNRTNIVNKNPCDQIIKDLTEPLLEVYTVKNTYTNTLGQSAWWYIDKEHKALIPYNKVDDNEDTISQPYSNEEIKPYENEY